MLILSNDLFQKIFLIFTPQARNLIDYPKQKNVIYQKFMSVGQQRSTDKSTCWAAIVHISVAKVLAKTYVSS